MFYKILAHYHLANLQMKTLCQLTSVDKLLFWITYLQNVCNFFDTD